MLLLWAIFDENRLALVKFKKSAHLNNTFLDFRVNHSVSLIRVQQLPFGAVRGALSTWPEVTSQLWVTITSDLFHSLYSNLGISLEILSRC